MRACVRVLFPLWRRQGFLPSSPALVLLLALFAAAAVTDLFIVPIYDQVASSFFGRGRQTRWLRVS